MSGRIDPVLAQAFMSGSPNPIKINAPDLTAQPMAKPIAFGQADLSEERGDDISTDLSRNDDVQHYLPGYALV